MNCGCCSGGRFGIRQTVSRHDVGIIIEYQRKKPFVGAGRRAERGSVHICAGVKRMTDSRYALPCESEYFTVKSFSYEKIYAFRFCPALCCMQG